MTVRSLTSRPNTTLVVADTAFLLPFIDSFRKAGFAWLFSGGSPFSVGSSQSSRFVQPYDDQTYLYRIEAITCPGQRAAVAWWSSSHIFSIQAEQVVDALRLELRTDTAYKAVAITNLATHR